MIALDAASGKVLWETGHTADFEMMSATVQHGPGPKSTPVFSNGRLYAIGMTGIVTAYDTTDGRQVWQKPGSPDLPMFTTHAFSPLVEGGLVIFHLGGDTEGAITAFDVNTGDLRWTWRGDPPGYGSPVLATLGGTRQIVTITKGRLVGIATATGALLWERPWVSPNFTNSNTPVVSGDLVIVSRGGRRLTEDPSAAFFPQHSTRRDGLLRGRSRLTPGIGSS
jgi:outer membrane protein assembly factor BamB